MSGPHGHDLLLRPVDDAPRSADGRIDLDGVVAAVGPCDLLESAGDVEGWSYVAPHAGPVLRDDGHRTVLIDEHGAEDLGTDPFAAIDELCARLGIGPDAPPTSDDAHAPPFTGGLVGALSYDLGRRVERVPRLARADRPTDHLHLRRVDLALALAPDRDRLWVVGRDLGARGDLEQRAARIAERVRAAVPASPVHRPGTGPPATTSLPRDAYLRAVESALAAIGAGRAFQVNLTQRLSARWEAGTHALYRSLRAHSPAPFGASLPAVGVASVSPETFLAVDGRTVQTRPIKGTRPRASDAELDAAHADDLVTSAKDRAENVMVVDLERNDLGRVCETGSVHVPQLCHLEAHPTVWHLVSTVAGRLREGVGYGDLLRATFPCGSITGAPKVAAMELIEGLEPVRRGWYCGAVGYLAAGHARLSVAIRTAVLHPDGTVDYGAGGGVVADSDPSAEHRESLDKATAFLRTVGAPGVDDRPALEER